jgi:hypothetical protein
MDMLQMTLRAMGIEPDLLTGTAMKLGAAFESIVADQAVILAKLDELRSGQIAIMAGMGLDIPAPTGSEAELIALESQRLMDSYGGPILIAGVG